MNNYAAMQMVEQRRWAMQQQERLQRMQNMILSPSNRGDSEDDSMSDSIEERQIRTMQTHDHANGDGDGMTRSTGNMCIAPTNGTSMLEADEAPRPPLEPHEKGMTVGYKQLYSGKEDKRGRFSWQTEIPKDLGKPAEDAETEKWALIVRRFRVYNNPKKVLSLHSIKIQSPLVKEILDEILEGYPGVSIGVKCLEFSGRFEPLVHCWPQLRRAIADLQKKLDEGDETVKEKIQHVKLLDDLLVEEFSEVEDMLNDMRESGGITFPNLWTIFRPDCLIFARHEGHDRGLRLQSSHYGNDNENRPVFGLECVYVDFDGRRFGTQKLNINIPMFEGTKKVNSLRAFPITLHDQYDNIKAKLTERGAKVEALAGSHFRIYDGIGWRFNRLTGRREKHTVKGRIIIDPFGYNRFQPDHAVYVMPFTAAPAASFPNRRIPSRTICVSRRTVGDPPPMPLSMNSLPSPCDDMDDYGMPTDGFSENENDVKKRQALTEDQRLCCTPVVRGYALREKQWLHFVVNAVYDIPFNERAFSSLSLPQNQKDLILGFTSVQQSYRTQFDDVIEGKGKGIVILLSGPPGVGKTLTAESVAEQMQVPLYMMAAGDLGLDPSSVESKLRGIMTMCSRWGAILLLDEADIFLEERSLHELERNKLVSIFLRVLEYYEGIMFLTTNRVQTFDAAFQSRIHISLEYPELDKKSRTTIWVNFLKQHDIAQASLRDKPAGPLVGQAKSQPAKKSIADELSATDGNDGKDQDLVKDIAEAHLILTQPHQMSEMDIDMLADHNLNGRQIKNILKTAQLLAVYKQEPLSYAHVVTVVDTTQHLYKSTEATDRARNAVYS